MVVNLCQSPGIWPHSTFPGLRGNHSILFSLSIGFLVPSLPTRRRQCTPLQYPCLENPIDGGAWWAAVHGVAKSRAWLSNLTFTFHFHALEKEMATHSTVFLPGESQGQGTWWAAVYGVAQSQTRLKRPSSSSSSSQQLCAKYWQYVGRGKTVSSSLINSLSHSNDIFPLKSSCLISSLSLTIKKAFHSCLFFSAHHLFSL